MDDLKLLPIPFYNNQLNRFFNAINTDVLIALKVFKMYQLLALAIKEYIDKFQVTVMI